MRHFFLIAIILLACAPARAEEARYVAPKAAAADNPTPSRRTDILTIYYGGEWLADSYLSPLLYDGFIVGLGNEWWTDFRKQRSEKMRWRHVGALLVNGGYAIQSRYQNSMGFIDISAGWGAHPLWCFNTGKTPGIESSHVELFIGPYLGADLMMKSITQNVNKPYSFDIGTDLCFKAGMGYAFRCKRTAYRLVYEAEMNVLGAMWLPDYWESYYEISEMVNIDGSVVCSHWGNRQYLKQLLAMDFEFKRSSWRLGLRHEYQHYGDNKRHFARQQLSLSVACIFDYKLTKSRF